MAKDKLKKKRLSPKEIVEIYMKYPTILSSPNVIFIEKLDTGQSKLFIEVEDKKYLVFKSISNHDTWYEIENQYV